MKRIFIFITLLFAFLFANNSAFAQNFYISNYDVKMQVAKDKSVNVEENINVVFLTPSHGIYRTIPLKNGEKINVNSVSENYTTNIKGNDTIIKIGNPDALVNGKHSYKISYTHRLSGKKDEFYYNIIGTNWSVPIEKASFYVLMPEKYNPNKAGLSIGKYGTKGFEGGAKFSANNKELTGETTDRKINPGEGITLRISLPDNYFSLTPDYAGYCILFIMLLLTLIPVLVWYNIGRDEHVTPVINFYPPESYNSAQAEVMYSGKATRKGLISLIIWLANKGYLKIESAAGCFTITKVKDFVPEIGQTAVYEFMNTLVEGEKVTSGQLRTSPYFYKECDSFIEEFNNVRNCIFESASISLTNRLILWFCIAALIVLEVLICVNFNINTLFEYSPLLAPIIIITITILNYKQNRLITTIYGVIALFAISGAFLERSSFPALSNPLFILGLICIVIASICLYQLPKRNKTGNKILSQLLGFKKFLETVEVSRVERLVDENPQYCFEVLPYLYIFDLSDRWINQFERFFRRPPDWYSGESFGYGFRNFTDRIMEFTAPSLDNGGIERSSSSGGGGFAGGGSGGGGGGSW